MTPLERSLVLALALVARDQGSDVQWTNDRLRDTFGLDLLALLEEALAEARERVGAPNEVRGSQAMSR